MGDGPGFRQWTVPQPKAVLLLVHGLGAHSGRWGALAGYFASKGIASFAIDRPDSTGFVKEILRVRSIISASYPGKKTFIVGESLGGIASFIAASRYPDLFDGLACISPAFKSVLNLPQGEYLRILISLVFDSKREVKLPFDFSMCTRDREYLERIAQDERERREVPSGAIVETITSQFLAGLAVSRLNTPVIFMISGDDKIIDSGYSCKIFARLKAPDKTIKIYPDMYHSLSIDIGKEMVFEDLREWIEKRL